MRDRATLTIALASVSRDGGLAVGLNGRPPRKITAMKDDGSLLRNTDYLAPIGSATFKKENLRKSRS